MHLACMREEEEPSSGNGAERDDDQDSKRLNVRQNKHLENVPIIKQNYKTKDLT